jgi:hypothetical protein
VEVPLKAVTLVDLLRGNNTLGLRQTQHRSRSDSDCQHTRQDLDEVETSGDGEERIGKK